MKIGTKSLLFGVHQFFLHPLMVGIAWRRLYGRWPTLIQWVSIIVHDWGYWNCPNLDGDEGRYHPNFGALLAARICVQIFKWRGGYDSMLGFVHQHSFRFCAGHSVNFARMMKFEVSPLYLADKASVLIEPRWLYLLRARLSGEIWEYIDNSPFKGIPGITPADWLDWYRTVTKNKINESRLHRWPVSGRQPVGAGTEHPPRGRLRV